MSDRLAQIIHAGQGQDIGLGRILLAGGSTDGQFSVLEMRGRPGVTVPAHVHRDAAELFYVLEGELIVRVGREETVLAAGGLAYVPRGVAHGHRNRADQPARWLTLFAPGGMEGYFAERAVQVAAGTRGAADYAGIDEAGHMALRSRYGIELVPDDASG